MTFDKVACGACGTPLWIGDDTCDVCGTERRPGGEDDEQKLEELGLSLGSRLLVSRIQEVASLLAQGAGDPELDEKLDRALTFLKYMEDALLVPLEGQLEERRRRDNLGEYEGSAPLLLDRLRVRKGPFGDAGAISRSQPRYGRAIESINRLADAQRAVERIF